MTSRRRGWFVEFTRLFFKALRRVSDRHAPVFAAGVAFFVFLSLFPALIAAVFSYGLIADAETIASHGERLAKLLPAEAAPIVTMQLDELAENPPSTLGWGVLTAMGVAIWSASRGAFYLLTAVQWIFDLEDVRSTFRQRVLAISMIAGTVVFAFLSIGLIAVLPPILAFLELDEAWTLLRSGRWLFLGAFVLASIGLLFRLAERESIRPRKLVSPGALMATGSWIVVSFGFSIYVDSIANYGKTYGTLTGVVVLMIWIWLGTLSILFGAAFEVVREEREASGR